MCRILVVTNPKKTTPENWRVTMYPELFSAAYVSSGYKARVYGLNQLEPYRDIPHGLEAAILASEHCSVASRTAEATSGEAGIKLMVRLGLREAVKLPGFTETSSHGELPESPGR